MNLSSVSPKTRTICAFLLVFTWIEAVPASADGQNKHGSKVTVKGADANITSSMNAWRERFRDSREKYLARLNENREKRSLRATAAKRDDKTETRKTPRYTRDGEEGVVRFSVFQRNKRKSQRGTGNKTKGPFGGLIAKYAKQHGVPVSLAKAVVQVESSFRPNVTGGAGEIGLMQIKLSTARGMGYKGSRKQLYDPATNLYWGMKYLGRAHQISGGSTCGTILRYNAGHYAKRMNPVSSRYCSKVRRILA